MTDAFSGKSFNEFHGMFCMLRRFVHRYHMVGRVSEESNEAYNGILANTKKVVKCTVSHNKRIAKIAERLHGKLKGRVMRSRLQIEKENSGKRRGLHKPRSQA